MHFWAVILPERDLLLGVNICSLAKKGCLKLLRPGLLHFVASLEQITLSFAFLFGQELDTFTVFVCAANCQSFVSSFAVLTCVERHFRS